MMLVMGENFKGYVWELLGMESADEYCNVAPGVCSPLCSMGEIKARMGISPEDEGGRCRKSLLHIIV